MGRRKKTRPVNEQLNALLQRYRGRDLVLAIDSEDGVTILAESPAVQETARLAKATGRKFFLVYTPPAQGLPPFVFVY
mgnify:CR=1 FL=1